MCATCTGRAAAFFSASGPSLSQEVADGKINVQSACPLNTMYFSMKSLCPNSSVFHVDRRNRLI
jgi:hypothetical protein